MEREKTFEEILEEISEFLEARQFKAARDILIEHNAVVIAELLDEIIDDIGMDKAVILFRMLPKHISVDVFAYLPLDDQVDIISSVTEKETEYILDEMEFDDMIDVLEELPANVVDKIIAKTSRDKRRLINTFLNYPDDCAGSIMTPNYISLREDFNVEEALAYVKKEGMDSETIYTCYVKDQGRSLLGIVSLRTLVISDDNVPITDIMKDDYVYVNVYDDREEVSEVFKKYDFLALPVVDKENRLVGIITVDDIIDVIEEENTEDFERMAGILDDSDKRYLDTSVIHNVKTRLPWILILMVSLMITGHIITKFEDVLSQVIVLVAYLPLLMGTGGNTGSQASTLVIRGIALGELVLSDAVKVLLKELRISLCIGIIISVLNFAKIYFFDGQSVFIALTVSLSMLFIVMIAKSIGGMLPLGAKRVGIDPALMATPMISSITDMMSVIIYFLLASAILGI
ncbi:MAG: magnesium transporter [Eubacteriales bacterium]|nr:magnesium transporter [Eubacteriales bacterium]MDD4390041.1 magnesium transporter [Eubacteriales bacterium]